jgi:REP element-mobilizing transposase RayT
LIGVFKTVSTKQINGLRRTPGARFWQRNYHEHIIRSEPDLNRIREYIQLNPLRWDQDTYHTTG